MWTFLLGLVAFFVPTSPVPAAPNLHVDRLAWLSGCWVDERSDPGSGETWIAPAGGTMLGVGRTVKDGKAVHFEFLHLHETEAGGLVYTAIPSGQEETDFEAVRADGEEAAFENPEHDFPQRIVYRRIGDDELAVRVEGRRGDETRGFEYTLKRGPCEKAPGADVE